MRTKMRWCAQSAYRAHSEWWLLCVLLSHTGFWRRARGCGSIVCCSKQLSGFPVSSGGLDVVPGLLELAKGRRFDKNGSSRAKQYDLTRYPSGMASCYFRLNWAFCFWTCVSKRNFNCTWLPSVFTSQSLFIHAACKSRFKTALRRMKLLLAFQINALKFSWSLDTWGETRPCADSWGTDS